MRSRLQPNGLNGVIGVARYRGCGCGRITRLN
jgi:hypothetical protein